MGYYEELVNNLTKNIVVFVGDIKELKEKNEKMEEMIDERDDRIVEREYVIDQLSRQNDHLQTYVKAYEEKKEDGRQLQEELDYLMNEVNNIYKAQVDFTDLRLELERLQCVNEELVNEKEMIMQELGMLRHIIKSLMVKYQLGNPNQERLFNPDGGE